MLEFVTYPSHCAQESAALFIDADDPIAAGNSETMMTLGDLDFSTLPVNAEARIRFRQLLLGIINV